MDELYPLFFENLSDSISSVRQGAAVSLGNVVKAYGRWQFINMILTRLFVVQSWIETNGFPLSSVLLSSTANQSVIR